MEGLEVSRYRAYMHLPMLPVRTFYSPLPEVLDIALVGEFRGGRFEGILEYETSLIAEGTARSLLKTFEAGLRRMVAESAIRIDDIWVEPTVSSAAGDF